MSRSSTRQVAIRWWEQSRLARRSSLSAACGEQRVRQVRRQDSAGARIGEAHLPAVVDLEPGALVEGDRLRMVERAGVHPEAAGRAGPGREHRLLEEPRAEPA